MRAFAPKAPFSRFLLVPLALLAACAGLCGGCSTDAIGIAQCREIEFARCEASATCGIIDLEEVDGCKRFYDDHCLHGIAGDEEPSAQQQKTCVELIESAHEQAKDSADQEAKIEEFEEACQVVAAPWDKPECSYLKKSSGAGGAKSEDEDEKK